MIDDELIVVEAVFLVPEPVTAEGVDGIGDVDEVLEELGGDVLVGGAVQGQFDGHGEHEQAVGSHPCGAVGLVEVPSARQGTGAVKHPDIVEPEESAAEDVAPFHILAVDPPSEIQQQLLKGLLQKLGVPLAFGIGHFIHPPHGPSVNGRIDVGEIPLVGGELSVRVHVPLAQ